MKTGLALVIQGGSVRGLYAAGVLDVLMENGFEFDYVIGTSAGSLCGYNFVAGDIGRSKKIVVNMMSSPKFFSLNNLLVKGTAFDFNYLFKKLPERYPFNQQAFEDSKSKFYAATTSLEDGRCHYFEKRDLKDFTIALQASSSMPLFAKPVEIDGAKYLDGGQSEPIPYSKAFEDGYERAVVITTRDRSYRKKPISKWQIDMASRFYKGHQEYIEAFARGDKTYNDSVEKLYELEKEGKCFLFAPTKPITISRIERNKAKLSELYFDGRHDAEDLIDDLRKFINHHE